MKTERKVSFFFINDGPKLQLAIYVGTPNSEDYWESHWSLSINLFGYTFNVDTYKE